MKISNHVILIAVIPDDVLIRRHVYLFSLSPNIQVAWMKGPPSGRSHCVRRRTSKLRVHPRLLILTASPNHCRLIQCSDVVLRIMNLLIQQREVLATLVVKKSPSASRQWNALWRCRSLFVWSYTTIFQDSEREKGFLASRSRSINRLAVRVSIEV